ncbi:unnamed protein product [Trypanosoma congolense IL3000]|uniref:WGS project CAEQ00000000 data, annotated contig 447 n=1 Tax=Trypanosoma congolense (strain IL3000) TaxID=1068625 RepID=F9WG04_TRYCI|nr:unnamed protein product [Trypanosoma congolense IL3000]
MSLTCHGKGYGAPFKPLLVSVKGCTTWQATCVRWGNKSYCALGTQNHLVRKLPELHLKDGLGAVSAKIPRSLFRRIGCTRVAPRLIISKPIPHSLILRLAKPTESRVLSSTTLVLRDAASNLQAVRGSQLSASPYRRSFQRRCQMEPAALRQKGNKAPTAAIQRLGHSATHLNEALTRKERKGM